MASAFNMFFGRLTDMQLEREKYFNNFSDNCAYLSLIICQNSVSVNFLKIAWKMESKTRAMNASYIEHYWSLLHLEWIFSP